jgi:hypothetical protein
MAPTAVTAATSSGVLIDPIGASWTGTSHPTSVVKRVCIARALYAAGPKI